LLYGGTCRSYFSLLCYEDLLSSGFGSEAFHPGKDDIGFSLIMLAAVL
jgi:hypothetical protein